MEEKDEGLIMGRTKDVTFVIKLMHGGGAERVVSVLSHALVEKGYTVRLILTHQTLKDAWLGGMDERVAVYSVEDDIEGKKAPVLSATWRMATARMRSKCSRLFLKKESDNHKLALTTDTKGGFKI